MGDPAEWPTLNNPGYHLKSKPITDNPEDHGRELEDRADPEITSTNRR